MSAGKLAAQAGHAFLDSFLLCQQGDPLTAQEYNTDKHGTKITLGARDKEHLIVLYDMAREAGLPTSLIVDEHHIMLPHFDGSPIITAIGIGPCRRDQIQHITKKLELIK